MGHFWRKELQEMRDENLDLDKPTPKVSKKKEKRPFILERRYIGEVNPSLNQFGWFSGDWIKYKAFETRKSAEQCMEANKKTGSIWSENWEYRIQEL